MSKSSRISSNSLQHRVKNRVWQTLLMMLPKFKEVTLIIALAIRKRITSCLFCKYTQEFVASILSSIFEAGFCSNQASVKYLIEWTVILILVRYPQQIDNFWACFNMVSLHIFVRLNSFIFFF